MTLIDVCTSACGCRSNGCKLLKCGHVVCKSCAASNARCAACRFDDVHRGCTNRVAAVGVGPRFDEGCILARAACPGSTCFKKKPAEGRKYVVACFRIPTGRDVETLEVEASKHGFWLRRVREGDGSMYELVDRTPVVYMLRWGQVVMPYRRRGSLHPEMERLVSACIARLPSGDTLLESTLMASVEENWPALFGMDLRDDRGTEMRWLAYEPEVPVAASLVRWAAAENVSELAGVSRTVALHGAMGKVVDKELDALAAELVRAARVSEFFITCSAHGSERSDECRRPVPDAPQPGTCVIWNGRMHSIAHNNEGVRRIYECIAFQFGLSRGIVHLLEAKLSMQPREWCMLSVDALAGAALATWGMTSGTPDVAVCGTHVLPRPTLAAGEFVTLKVNYELAVPLRCLAAFSSLYRDARFGRHLVKTGRA